MKWLTRRNWSVSNRYKIEKLNQLTRGWINYFGIGYMKWSCKDMDALIRRRLRMCIWVHWKTPQNRAKNLIKLGMYSKKAYAIAYSGARVARLSEGALNYVITNKRLCLYGNSGRNRGRRYVTLSRWEYPKTWQCKRVIPDGDIGSQRIQLQ